MSPDADDLSLDSRVRRLLARPWFITYETERLATLDGYFSRRLTATGLILCDISRARSAQRQFRALSVVHTDAESRPLGQAYLEEAEVQKLIEVLTLDCECAPRPDAARIRGVHLRTRDGLTIGWQPERRDWTIVLTLRSRTTFALPAARKPDLCSFLQESLDRLRATLAQEGGEEA